MAQQKIFNGRIIILFVLIGLAVYANAVNGAFLWDDHYFIENNATIRSFAHFPRVFLEHIGSGSHHAYMYYRPLQELSYMADYHLWGLDPRGYHLTNILLHVAAALMVLGFIHVLTGNRKLAVTAAALFLILPVQVESVSYLSGRGEPLSLIFMLLSFRIYLGDDAGREGMNVLLIGLTALCAFFTKENTVILPLLLVSYHFFCRKKILWRRFVPVLVSLALYGFFRWQFVHAPVQPGGNLVGWWGRVPGFFDAVLQYSRLLVFPFHLHFDYGQRLFSWMDLSVIAGIALCGGLGVAAVMNRSQRPLVGFAVAWFFIALLPYSNLYLIFNYMAEHNLYAASVAFSAVLAAFLLKTGGRLGQGFKMWLLVVAAGVYYAGITVAQNAYWQDPVRFYRRTLKYNPESWSAYHNLGNEYARRHDRREALACYEKALALKPEDPLVLNNLALTLRDAGDLAGARQVLEALVKEDPGWEIAHNNLGLVYKDLGQMDAAGEEFDRSIMLNPRFIDGYVNRGALYFDRKQYPLAAAVLTRAAAVERNNAGVQYHLGLIYLQSGDHPRALEHFQWTLRLQPGHKKAAFHLAAVLLRLGRDREAERVLDRVFPDAPEQAMIRKELATIRPEMP